MKLKRLLVIGIAAAVTVILPENGMAQATLGSGAVKRVLLLSIDGMHAVDFYNCSHGIMGVNDGRPYCPNMSADHTDRSDDRQGVGTGSDGARRGSGGGDDGTARGDVPAAGLVNGCCGLLRPMLDPGALQVAPRMRMRVQGPRPRALISPTITLCGGATGLVGVRRRSGAGVR
jgi:hypothetical protein